MDLKIQQVFLQAHNLIPPPQHSIFGWANLWSQAMMAELNLVNFYA